MKNVFLLCLAGLLLGGLVFSGCSDSVPDSSLTSSTMNASTNGSLASESKLTGAIFTTNLDGAVNVDSYAAKEDVYLNGGPEKSGAAGLPDGLYYVQITEPNGAVLGKSLTAVLQVVDGEFVQLYQLSAIVYTATSTFTTLGFDTTTNVDGDYKVWVSPDPTFPNNKSKKDNFQIIELPASA